MKKNLCTIYIVRHGESEANVLISKGEVFDLLLEEKSHLSEKGKQQVAQLAEKLKKINFDAIFSSDYIRAQETAEILKHERKLAVLTHHAIRERQFGKWAGRWHLVRSKLQEEIRKIPEDQKTKYSFEDVEVEENLISRFSTFIREIAVAYPGKTVLVVSHSNSMRMFLYKLGYGTYHQISAGAIDNAGYYVVESDGTDFFLKETSGIKKME